MNEPDSEIIRVSKGLQAGKPTQPAREDWAAAFAEMAHRGDDVLLDEDSLGLSSWDEEEWKW